LRDVKAGDLFEHIRNAHYNINTGIEERKEQRQKLAEKKQHEVSTVHTEKPVESATS
jgi:hypothetical protein